MTSPTGTIIGNPLSSSSSQVGGTRALSVIIEPEPVAAVSEAPAENAVAVYANGNSAVSATAVVETKLLIAPADPIAGLERHATDMAEGVRIAVQDSVARTEAGCESTLDVFEQASHTMKAALDEAGTGATTLTFKLVEFAQANAKNTLDLARDYASVRTLPDVFNAQAAYVRRQFHLLTAQAEEFRQLTTGLTAKTAAPFKAQASRSMQAFRSC